MGIKSWLENRKYKEQRKEIEMIRQDVKKEIEAIEDGSMSALRLAYADLYEQEKVQNDMVLYEAYAGRGLICSPYAIFKCFMNREDFHKYKHVWVLENLEMQAHIVEEYKKYSNVFFVQRDTEEYCTVLCQAKFLITNLSFPNYYTKKKEQIYINSWHGIPLKTLGFDIPDGRITGLNTIRNFLSVDVFLSPNRFMTERFLHSFCLEGVYEGKIMESGMPRNDNFFHTERKEIIEKLQEAGVDIDPDKKLIMYAPTWKGDRYSAPDTSTELYFQLMKTMEENMNTDEYQILVKPHQIVYKHIVDKGELLTSKFIPATVDTNEILSVVDVLISDYSSIYFDYLASGRPILFYIPDLQEYKTQRGLYFGIDKLPGPIAESFDELAKMLADLPAAIAPFKEKYAEEKEWACSNDDGNVCQRVIDTVIVNQDFSNMISCDYQSKKKVLVYSGAIKAGKLRDKLDQFIKEFDFEVYDLTLIIPHTESEEIFEWIRNIDPRVRVLRRTGTHAANEDEKLCMEIIAKHGVKDPLYEVFYKKYFPRKAYKRELQRIVGQTHYDYAVEFSQKSPYFKNLFSCLDGTKVIGAKKIDMFKSEKSE